jgi:hypothetical protein
MSRLGPFRVDSKLICLKSVNHPNSSEIDATLTNRVVVEMSC